MTDPVPGRQYPVRRALLLGFGGLAVLIGGLSGWTVLASISGAVIATGRIEVETRNQVVEHIDGGTVQAILVRDGDAVTSNEVLLRFSDAPLRSEEAILGAQYAELVARRNRLEAEFRDTNAIVWDRDVAAIAESAPRVREILDGQERLFRARAASRVGEVARLRNRIGRAHEEIAGLEARAVALEQQGELIHRELAVHRRLFEKGLTQLDRLLALERATRNLEGQQGTNAAAIARARGRIEELELQILQVDTLRIEKAEEQARDAAARENQVRERLASVRERLGRMEVRAPVAGVVFGMTVSATREVVHPGEPILHIVPEGARLVVLARLDPIHVDQVYPGQEAVLRFSAFPARMTPELDGRVVRVSADAVRDAESGLSWYEVELAIGTAADRSGEASSALAELEDALGSQREPSGGRGGEPPPRSVADELVLTPGMPVEVHIRTAERSLMSYLTKPVSDFFRRGLREE